MADTVPHDLHTIPEAARLTGAAQRTIRSWIKRDRLQALPSRRGQMVSLAAVQVLLTQSKRATASAARMQAPADAAPAAIQFSSDELERIRQQLQRLEAIQTSFTDLPDLARAIAAQLARELAPTQHALPPPKRRRWWPF